METQDDALAEQPSGFEHEADSLSEATVVDPNSESFVGRWQSLVSQTNWEKGKIISEWRQAKIDDGATSSQYSDEAWASMVGFVTCQHVGRLRRVYDRFGETWSTYAGLYWSHFWAALDWDDAELWLEGASQSHWSISQMRRTRAKAMKTTEATYLVETSRIAEASDDGFMAIVDGSPEVGGEKADHSLTVNQLHSSLTDRTLAGDSDQEETSSTGSKEKFQSGPKNESPDFGESIDSGVSFGNADRSDYDTGSTSDRSGVAGSSANDLNDDSLRGNPFESLGDLPQDVRDAVEQFKLCIIRHRASHWQEIRRSELLAALDALRAFC